MGGYEVNAPGRPREIWQRAAAGIARCRRRWCWKDLIFIMSSHGPAPKTDLRRCEPNARATGLRARTGLDETNMFSWSTVTRALVQFKHRWGGVYKDRLLQLPRGRGAFRCFDAADGKEFLQGNCLGPARRKGIHGRRRCVGPVRILFHEPEGEGGFVGKPGAGIQFAGDESDVASGHGDRPAN